MKATETPVGAPVPMRRAHVREGKPAMTARVPLTARQSWKALQAHWTKIGQRHLRTLFADDPTRGERMAVEAAGLYLDYSKNRITDETVALLCRLAEECGLRARIEAMFRGEKINVTERSGRPARGPARPARHVDRRGRQGRRARGPRRPRRHGRVRDPGAQRRMEGSHRQAHSQHRQHRHRRLRPRPRDGLRGAQALQPSRD